MSLLARTAIEACLRPTPLWRCGRRSLYQHHPELPGHPFFQYVPTIHDLLRDVRLLYKPCTWKDGILLRKRPFIALLLCIFLFLPSLPAGAASRPLSPADEGLNVPIMLSPGRSLQEARRQVAEANRISRQDLLMKNEGTLMFGEMTAQQRQLMSGAQLLGSDPPMNNSFSGTVTEHGNILLAFDGMTPGAWCAWLTVSGYCHAGLWDKAKYNGTRFSLAIRTANRDRGVKYEDPRYWQAYLEVREMRVTNLTAAEIERAVALARTYAGPYRLDTTKMNNDKWYCSKIPWRAYFDATHRDLDGDWGNWVLPGDIRWDDDTESVRIWK